MIMGDFNITLSQIDIFRKQNKKKGYRKFEDN